MLQVKPIVFTTLALVLPYVSYAASLNPASEGYVQAQIASVMSYLQTQVSALTVVPTYTVGQQALGGQVFYVDSSGMHGLVAAISPTGLGTGQYWDGGISAATGGNNIITNATGDGIGAGAINSSLMLSVQSGYFAYLSSPITDPQTPAMASMPAQVCVGFSVQADGQMSCNSNSTSASCYADWYVPSIYELNLMYLQKTELNYPIVIDQDAFIWSSTELNQNEAYRINFTDIVGPAPALKSSDGGVWCIREF